MPQVQVIQPIQQQPKRLRVAAYARVSSDSEDQLNSLSVQVDYYTHLIQENPNWDFAGIYADEGITGTSTKHREQFNRLLDDCRAGLIDRVLVKSASRFARNTADALASVREMKSLGVTVVFEKEGFDTETSNGEMILSMICAVAQEESLSISKNLKWGIRKRMQNGTYTNSSVPFGYSLENHLLVINNQQAMIVADIFKRYLAGESISKIAQYLNNTYPKETGVWQYSSVQLILQNETYKGDTRYQKHYTANLFPTKVSHNRGQVSQYYIAKSHEAIISDEDFDKVQSLLKMKAPHKPKVAEKLFDQKLYCAVCGTLFARKTRTSGAVVWGCRKHLNKSGLCSVKLHRAILKAVQDLYYNAMSGKVKADVKRKPTRNARQYADRIARTATERADSTEPPRTLTPTAKKRKRPAPADQSNRETHHIKGKPIIAWFAPQSKGVYHEQYRNFVPR